ncbi:MAG TPA: hypothetical protein DD640_00375 [Clostridiales bacterium]|nr:hypothetical protein [Clostridiales bacterium]
MKSVILKDAYAAALSDTSWEIAAQGLRLVWGFTPECGLALQELAGGACGREIAYCCEPQPLYKSKTWTLESACVRTGIYGGRPVVQLDVQVKDLTLAINFHAVAFPDCPVVRYWYELTNTSFPHGKNISLLPFTTSFIPDHYKDTYWLRWFTGGNSHFEQGLMHGQALSPSFGTEGIHLKSRQTNDFVPLVLLMREGDPCDGLMVQMDYCAPWSFDLDYSGANPIHLRFCIEGSLELPPEETVQAPTVTLCAFSGGLDRLMEKVFDWQYTYLWDYANPNYHAKTRCIGNWVYCARNLHEQFTHRLANFNLNGAQEAQELGYDLFWDDAGWSSYPGWPPDEYGSVFHNTYEGPDFALSQRFFAKCSLKWLLWFAGKPSLGLLQSKESAWGSFEWRTDALTMRDLRDESQMKQHIRAFLEENPDRSFHTCSGGSQYSHTFDIQRYANYNYFSDMGLGPYLNYYLSFFETPDRWGDILLFVGDRHMRHDGSSTYFLPGIDRARDIPAYSEEFARSRLCMVPTPGPNGKDIAPSDKKAMHRDLQIYRYFKQMGVAGRWSYLYHPEVHGDQPFRYMQRTSRDHRHAVIIPTHRPAKFVSIFPRGLIDACNYEVALQNEGLQGSRTGADLMQNGIHLASAGFGELIYLNLPDYPGCGHSPAAPVQPACVLIRQETNIGCTGAGVYWTPGTDDGRIVDFEVARAGKVIACVATGYYYFDQGIILGPDTPYAVRAIDTEGKASPWTKASPISGEPLELSAMGGHGPEDASGWHAEYSYDLEEYIPMQWIPPAANPAGDFGGTPNQPGGIEGWWQGPGSVRIGRGWQQADSAAYCVRTLAVPCTGKAHVTGRATKEWYHQTAGQDLRVCILHNLSRVWPDKDWALLNRGDLDGAMHDLCLELTAGDRLHFVLAPAKDNPCLPYDLAANLAGWIPRVVFDDLSRQAIPQQIIRINCGGGNIVDSQGIAWQADEYCASGDAIPAQETGEEDETVFDTARTGSRIVYEIPAEPGLYSLQLLFREPGQIHIDERIMRVRLGGRIVEEQLDITARMHGARKAMPLCWHCISPDAAGVLRLELESVAGMAIIQGIVMAPETTQAVRINCGSKRDFIDWAGNVWQADLTCGGGQNRTAGAIPLQVTPTLYDRALYLDAACGQALLYRISLQPGLYTLQLKFAELWEAKPGERTADVFVNGSLLRRGWDCAAMAGRKNMATGLRFEGMCPADGTIEIGLRATGALPAILQAIEIV